MSSCHTHNVSKIAKSTINAGQLMKLKTLFDSKQWDIEEGTEISYFERYARTLSHLQEDQQNFIIKLTERFDHIPFQCYLEHLVILVKRIRQDFAEDNLLFTCCLPKNDVGKTKSSAVVLYQFRGTTMKSRVDLGKHVVIESLSSELTTKVNLDNSHFVLVDDFIGTGETAIGAINYIHELFPALKDNRRISVLTIAAMKNGLKTIKDLGVSVYASVECSRGISDYYKGEELINAKETMKAIEKSLKKLKPKFKFGYRQSEALVCMERCPNNTFPIYWYTKHDAPYER